ncbi:MAG TPA: hypothetical protein DCE58_05825 [Cryomorphaceae bacterium]|nr:hypothetical protein [Cryomorphaceae bacterium]
MEVKRLPWRTEKSELIQLAMHLFGVHVRTYLLTCRGVAVLAVFPSLKSIVDARKERQEQQNGG